MNYVGKFSPAKAKVYEPLWKLTSENADWTWNSMYQKFYEKVKTIIKYDVFIKFYNENEPLYLETDALGIGLGTCLVQARKGLQFP